MTIGHALVAFTAAAGLLTITPGLDTALVGPRRAMLAGVGICLGCLTWGLAASVGLGALLGVSLMAYNTLRIAGACYLIFLGVKLLLRRPAPASARDEPSGSPAEASDADASAPRWFLRGFLTNILNPKGRRLLRHVLPQFIPAGVRVTWFSMLLAAIHATQGILWFALLTLATRPLSAWLRRARVARTLDRATGAVLVGCGLGLVLDRRH